MSCHEAQISQVRKLRSAVRDIQRRRDHPGLPPAFFLTDPERTREPETILNRLPEGWGVIYRHFGAEDRLATASRLLAIARRRKLVFLASADPLIQSHIALDGVHWPRYGLKPAPKQLDRRLIHTSPAHTRRDIVDAAAIGMSAVLLSAVYPSRSPNAPSALGPLRFRNLARTSPAPLYALGGVNAHDAAAIAQTARLALIDGAASAFQ